MEPIEEELNMDIIWIAASAAFFLASCGLVHYFGRLQEED